MLSTLARFFSFASLEIWRFIATGDGMRTMFLFRNLWMVPLTIVVWAAGIWQPFWMLREWFRTQSPHAGWQTLRWLVAGSVALVYASFWLVLEPPQAHSFYVLAPMAFMFAAYCWTFVDSPRWRRIAGAILAANIAFHIGQAWIQAPGKSIFRNRDVVAAAIRTKQPQLFAHRRAVRDRRGPVLPAGSSRPYDALQDVQFTNTRLTMGPRSVALWSFTLRIANPRVAFRDVLYQTHYRDANGQ